MPRMFKNLTENVYKDSYKNIIESLKSNIII